MSVRNGDLYTAKLYSVQGKSGVKNILQDILYSCGSGLQEIEHDDHSVLHKVFTRMNLNCASPIEIPYYNTNYEPLCYYCGSLHVLNEDSEEFHEDTQCASNVYLIKSQSLLEGSAQLPL